MEAIKHMIRAPKNHTIQLNIPDHVPENELVGGSMLIQHPHSTFDEKISILKSIMHDELFPNDLHDVANDFEQVNLQGALC